MTTQEFIADLNARYFNGELSESFTSRLEHMPEGRQDVREFVERMFMLMQRGGLPANDISSLQGDILGSLLARILPGAWEGRVPPITVAGRHCDIDEYLGSNSYQPSGSKRLLDLGCGFPPHTTVETANALRDWDILGADPSLPVYLVMDDEGNYATFDDGRNTVYFQPAVPSIENWNALLADSAATKQHFEELLDKLLVTQDGYSESELPKLNINPLSDYESDNLKFQIGGIGTLDVDPVDTIRCFNVLFYFDDAFRTNALEWFSTKLTDGGILITGGNWALSTESRYYVHQKQGDNFVCKDFAFSLDNLSPVGIVTWYANHDDDPEGLLLADYLKVLRSDEQFMAEYYEVHDALRVKYGVCPREESGYYGGANPDLDPAALWTAVKNMLLDLQSSGLVERAIEVLESAGHKARRNEIGHIAVSQS